MFIHICLALKSQFFFNYSVKQQRKGTYLSNILLDQFRPDDSDEAGICTVSHSSGTQGFPCTRRPEQQHTLWRLNTQVDKALRLKLKEIKITFLTNVHRHVMPAVYI